MPSANMNHDSPNNCEFHIYDIQAELISEICSYLQVHDQVTMKRVCKWWRINLSEAFLSRFVDIDNFRMLKQSEEFLEHTLNLHVQKNTKVLVLRHIIPVSHQLQDVSYTADGNEFGIVGKVVQQKDAALIQLILKDCEVKLEMSAGVYYWVHPERIIPRMMISLMDATKKLVLDNYTMRDALCYTLTWLHGRMPCTTSHEARHMFFENPAQIVLDRLEFDCNQPLQQRYHSLIMAMDCNCPEVSPEIRNEVMLLFNSWSHCDATLEQWKSLRKVMQCLNEGTNVGYQDPNVDVSALRKLDPLTFNKLTVQALHRLYL